MAGDSCKSAAGHLPALEHAALKRSAAGCGCKERKTAAKASRGRGPDIRNERQPPKRARPGQKKRSLPEKKGVCERKISARRVKKCYCERKISARRGEKRAAVTYIDGGAVKFL